MFIKAPVQIEPDGDIVREADAAEDGNHDHHLVFDRHQRRRAAQNLAGHHAWQAHHSDRGHSEQLRQQRGVQGFLEDGQGGFPEISAQRNAREVGLPVVRQVAFKTFQGLGAAVHAVAQHHAVDGDQEGGIEEGIGPQHQKDDPGHHGQCGGAEGHGQDPDQDGFVQLEASADGPDGV